MPVLVILAAGASRRMGSCKALLELGGKTALEHLLGAGACIDDLPPLVVTGAHDAEIRAHLARIAPSTGPVEVVCNPRWAEGRTGGLALAVARRPGRDVVVAPIDVPLVAGEVFRQLAAAWKFAGSPARGWLAPARVDSLDPGSAHFGHPVVIGHALLEELSEFGNSVPLRVLRERATPLWSIPVLDPGILDDLDEPGDLESLRNRIRSQ